MGKYLKVAVVGGSGIFGSHSMAYPENPNAVPVAFVDVIPSRAKKSYDTMLNEHLEPALEYYMEEEPENSAEIDRLQLAVSSLKERGVCDNIYDVIDDVDMFDICTPNKFHVPYSMIALHHGKSAMSEKPPGRSWWEVMKLREVAKTSKGFYQINENEFFRPLWHAMAKALDEGKVGDIKSVTAQLGHLGPSWGYHGHFFDPYYNGGGCTQDLGVHALGIMMCGLGWIHGGPMEKLELLSTKVKKMEKRNEARKMTTVQGVTTLEKLDFEDYAKFIMKFQHPKGYEFKATLETAWCQAIQGLCKIEGREGTLMPNVVKGQQVIEVFDKAGTLVETIIPAKDKYGNRDSHEREVLYFTDIINNGKGPSLANEDTSANLQQMITLAYYANTYGGKDKEATSADLLAWCQEMEKKVGPASDVLVDEMVSLLLRPLRADI